jgi:hypothetical protein
MVGQGTARGLGERSASPIERWAIGHRILKTSLTFEKQLAG